MRSQRYYPSPPLSAFVECFWYWEGAVGPHRKERLLPNGAPALIFNLREESMRIYDANDTSRFESYGRAVFSGARSDCFVIDTSQEKRVIGIQFRPAGAFPFFRTPASEMESASFELDDLWPRVAATIHEQLHAAASVEAMLLTLERCLLARLCRPLEVHPAVAYAVRCFERSADGGRVTPVTEKIGLSQRRFIEIFHQQVGLTPKAFSRVRRFQRAIQTIAGKREIEWPQLALDCGYYDQAHFIHDFQAFAGLTPTAYVALATLHLNHVPLP